MQIYRLFVNRESDCPIYFRVFAVFPRKFCPFPAAPVLTHARARAYPCPRPCLPMPAPVLTHARARAYPCLRPCLPEPAPMGWESMPSRQAPISLLPPGPIHPAQDERHARPGHRRQPLAQHHGRPNQGEHGIQVNVIGSRDRAQPLQHHIPHGKADQ